jgi:hypothetical protein
MKIIRLLTIVFISVLLFSCGNTEKNIEVAKIEPKKEIKKDYDYYLKRIADDELWMGRVKNQAEERGITVEKSLINNATYMASQNGFVVEIDDAQIKLNKQIQVIKNNEKWFSGVKTKAEERNISVDSMLIRAATHAIDQRK